MITVAAAVIERPDRRILIGQRRRTDSSPLKWEFPGGKLRPNETPEAALGRELLEELGVTLRRGVEIGRVRHTYSSCAEPLEIRFFAVEIGDEPVIATVFEKIAWALPKELGQYDFLAANAALVAHLATGKIKPGEIFRAASDAAS